MSRSGKSKICPWICVNEWESVHRNLYSNNISNQRWAINRIAVWKCRLPTKLPASIEVSSDLMTAKLCLLDATADNSKAKSMPIPKYGDKELRLILSTAIIRFINIMTESIRYNQMNKPVHILARELDIPEWMVELRHDATHAALPDLHTLSSGVTYALQWLQTRYWQVEEDELVDVAIPSSAALDHMSHILVAYQQAVTSSSEAPRSPHIRRVLKDCDDLLSKADTFPDFLGQMCQLGYLIPSEEQLKCLGVESVWSGQGYGVERALVDMWMPLLRRIHCYNRTVALIEQLTYACVGNSQERYVHTAAAWIIHLLYAITADITDATITAGCVNVTKLEPSCEINWHQMLSMLLAFPHQYTLYLLHGVTPLVTASGCFSQSQLSDMEKLVTSHGQDKTNDVHMGDSVHCDPNGVHNENNSVHDVTDNVQQQETGTQSNSSTGSKKRRKWEPYYPDGSTWFGIGLGDAVVSLLSTSAHMDTCLELPPLDPAGDISLTSHGPTDDIPASVSVEADDIRDGTDVNDVRSPVISNDSDVGSEEEEEVMETSDDDQTATPSNLTNIHKLLLSSVDDIVTNIKLYNTN